MERGSRDGGWFGIGTEQGLGAGRIGRWGSREGWEVEGKDFCGGQNYGGSVSESGITPESLDLKFFRIQPAPLTIWHPSESFIGI